MELDSDLGSLHGTGRTYLAWFQCVNEDHTRILHLNAFSLANVTLWVDFLHETRDLETEVSGHRCLHSGQVQRKLYGNF
jgi:hypothetical protein